MNTFDDFLHEQLKADNKSQGEQVPNVMVLYIQYIGWALAQESKSKTKPEKPLSFADLLLQLQIINAYYIHCLSLKTNESLEKTPSQLFEALKIERIKPAEIKHIYDSIIVPATQYFHKKQFNSFMRNLMIGLAVTITLSVSASIVAHMEAFSVLPFTGIVFLCFTVSAVFGAIASDMMGNVKAREKAFNDALKSSEGSRSIIKLVASKTNSQLPDNGVGQAIHATSEAMLTAWKAKFAHPNAEALPSDLVRVKNQLDRVPSLQNHS